MRKRTVLCTTLVLGFGVLSATGAAADPVTVTSGHVVAMPTGAGEFTILGDGFALNGEGQFESGLWACSPCRASDRLNLNLGSTADGSFASDGLSGEFDHTPVDHVWLAGHVAFTAEDMTSAVLDAGETAISVPFTFYAELANYASFREAVTSGNVPLFVATFAGRGVATAHFSGPAPDPDGPLFYAESITYDFTAPAPSPTPEPASLVLLGTGVAAAGARRRNRPGAPSPD
jgi:hypothetical protein